MDMLNFTKKINRIILKEIDQKFKVATSRQENSLKGLKKNLANYIRLSILWHAQVVEAL